MGSVRLDIARLNKSISPLWLCDGPLNGFLTVVSLRVSGELRSFFLRYYPTSQFAVDGTCHYHHS